MKKEAGKLQRVENAIKRMKRVEVIVMGGSAVGVREDSRGGGRHIQAKTFIYGVGSSFVAVSQPAECPACA